MSKAITRFNLDVTHPDVQVSVRIMQGDRNRQWRFTFTEAGRPFDLPARCTAMLVGTKPDDTVLQNGLVVQGNEVIYDFGAADPESGIEQISTAEGAFEAQILLFDEYGDVLHAPRIWVTVYASSYTKNMVATSENQFGAIMELIARIAGRDADVERLLSLISVSGTITIKTDEWSDAAPYTAVSSVTGIDAGTVTVFMPEDDATKEAAGDARLSMLVDSTIDGNPANYVVVARSTAGTAPTIDLNFRYIIFKTGTEDKALVAMVGVDAVGSGGTGGGVNESAVRSIINQVVPAWALMSTKPTYNKSEVGLGNVDNVKQYSDSNQPDYPVDSVNGMTGAVKLDAAAVGARPDDWTPTAEEVGARPAAWMPTAAQVGADPSGTAANKVSDHNTFTGSHNDIRILIQELYDRLNAFLDTDDATLDELSEIVAYIKSNKSLIDSITTSKVNVSDIINDLATNVSNRPLSAAQGVALKALIDTLSTGKLDVSALTAEKLAAVLGYTPANAASVPTALSQLTDDSTHRTVTDGEKSAWNNKVDKGDIVQEVHIGEGDMPEGAVLQIVVEEDDTVGAMDDISSAIATTFPPSQRPAAEGLDGSNIDVLNATADDIHAYIDEVVSGKSTVTKEILGKDASGKYDIARYTYANREYCAWVKDMHPKMYGWKNGATVMYTESVSPRVGDKAYDVPYIGGSGTSIETIETPAVAGWVYNQRYSQSGGAFSSSTTESSLIVPVEIESDITAADSASLTITGSVFQARAVYYGQTNAAFPNTATPAANVTAGGTTIPINTLPAGKWFLALTLSTSNSGVSDGTTVPNITVNLLGKTINTIAIGASSAAHATTTTTEVETEGGTLITEVKVADVATDATTNTIPSSRIIGGAEYVRSEADDVEPTVIYTDADDDRNSDASLTQDSITYHRYPLGDLGANRNKLIPIFIYANEHGINPARLDSTNSMYEKYETKMAALVAARFMRDLCAGKQMKNPLYEFIRENCMVIVIPVSNPFGYNMNVTGDTNGSSDGYYNANNVNSNRNFDTPGWIVSKNGGAGHHGDYPGSENETQYLMNTMVESGAVVAMSLHGIGGFFSAGGEPEYGICAHQGQNPDGSHYDKTTMKNISDFLTENYGYMMIFYDRREKDSKVDFEPPVGESINLPDRACKSPSYITQCGAYGGIVEFQPDDIKVSGYQQTYKGYIIENAYAQTLNLIAAWLADYLEQQ